MVNYGPSKGCRTCQKRRKKCDEARPYCERCVKAKISCSGYEDETNSLFRNHGVDHKSVFISYLSNRQFENSQATIDIIWIGNLALTEFLNDYCIVPKVKYLSRGYLAGLEELLLRVGPSSDVAFAARTAAFASLANKHRDIRLSQRAKLEYSKLLRSFMISMSKPETSNTLESLTAAVLLGIYEILSASKAHPGDHRAHYRGVGAILSSSGSVFSKHPVSDFWPKEDIIQCRHAKDPLIWPHDLILISPPDPGPSLPSLDTLLQSFSPVFRQGKLLTSNLNTSFNELQQFRAYAITVDREFAIWPAKQPLLWQRKTLGPVHPAFKKGLLPGLTSSPSRIDVYLDLFVGCVWNSFRKCRLVLLAFIDQCSQRLQSQDIHAQQLPVPTAYETNRILELAEELSGDILASVPFHLIRNPDIFLTPANGRQEAIPNLSAGGLLTMHSMFVASTSSIIPQPTRHTFREFLGWIGDVMGIGQAALFSEVNQLPREFIMDSHILVGAGLVIP